MKSASAQWQQRHHLLKLSIWRSASQQLSGSGARLKSIKNYHLNQRFCG
jgi:hypothetical protein